MFLLTPYHRLILGILEKTGVLSIAHVEALLAASDADMKPGYAKRLVSQLGHMQKVRPEAGDIISFPNLSGLPADGDMLSAIDVMLDISGGKISAVKRGEPPCKLCFLVETENGVGSYAVIPVPRGRETEVRFALGGTRTEKRMLVLLLENACQRENFNIEHPHFFALREESKIRYFE